MGQETAERAGPKRTCSARWRSFSASSMRSRVDFLSVGALNCWASCSASTWAYMHEKPADGTSLAAMISLQALRG